jgi:hypothetical protein
MIENLAHEIVVVRSGRICPDRTMENPMDFLLETGLLFHLNTAILHPMGLSWSVKCDDEGHVVDSFLEDHRDDPRTVYTNVDFQIMSRKLEAFISESGKSTMELRHKLLGFITQKAAK